MRTFANAHSTALLNAGGKSPMIILFRIDTELGMWRHEKGKNTPEKPKEKKGF